MRGKTGKGKNIEIDRERHLSHLELESFRMVLMFDYILDPGATQVVQEPFPVRKALIIKLEIQQDHLRA